MKKQFKTGFKICPLLTALFFFLAAWLLAVRLIGDGEGVHYHANFHIYINERRLSLEEPFYYEEVSACSAEAANSPKSRVHMHDGEAHLIHIHDKAVSYVHFLANLGFTLNDKFIEVNDQLYRDGQDGQLRFILNGQPITEITSKVIESEDVLLIDFGNADEAGLQKRYQEIPRDADLANLKQDPAACAGDGSSLSIWSKFKKAFGF